MFTPEEVVATFRSKNLKPVLGAFHCEVEDGKVVAVDGCCCPLTALAAGATVEEGKYSDDTAMYVLDYAECNWPGFNAWAFMSGYDSGGDMYHTVPGYDLGVACREALTKAFGVIETMSDE